MLANELTLDRRWGLPCLAFNIHLPLAGHTVRRLAEVQAKVLDLEPDLLTVPTAATHISVGWLIPVHEDFATPKETLWAEHAADWLAGIADAAAHVGPLTVHYRHLVATESAVIALAWPTDQVNTFRQALRDTLWLPGSFGNGNLVHTTLFRYRNKLADPARLLDEIADLDIEIDAPITTIHVIREQRFPSLEIEVQAQFPVE